MHRIFILLTIVFSACQSVELSTSEVEQWEQQAKQVNIIRDTYGVPHIYGKTDADVVFGLLYAQCEDDFNRVEMNYINAMGRLAETEGESAIFKDLRMKMFINPDDLKKQFEESPDWLKKLMVSFADGINYYLHTHPEVTPKVIKRFEPWMALSFSEGSIGGDIESVNIGSLKQFYGAESSEISMLDKINEEIYTEPQGSNGIAISPKLSASGNSLFLINPHTSFFFRSEVHMVSEEGLNAYGAVTWGQFFVYQGFNDRVGWMHTSSYADVIDYYLETVTEQNEHFTYQFGDEKREVQERVIEVPYLDGDSIKTTNFTGYFTHHGPVVAKNDSNWVAVALMQRPLDALRQSYLRTKAKNYTEFNEAMKIRTNSSNNTVYADADGNIAYYHGNYIPIRDTTFNWTMPVDGSNPATDYKGLHELAEIVSIFNPETGWIQNCNSNPFTASGSSSPNPANYASYIAPDVENYRGIHAARLLDTAKDMTIEKLKTLAYDSYMPAFEVIIPPLSKALNSPTTSLKSKPYFSELKKEIQQWNYRWAEGSVATAVATFWGQNALREAYMSGERPENPYEYVAQQMSKEKLLQILEETADQMINDFGKWNVTWGEVNRYQRLNGDIVQPFNDEAPSLPVGFASGRWGSLASFGARTYPDTKKMYGTSGNSFVAFVEFGDSLKAMSISTGGGNGDPNNPHFNDQAEMYTKGIFKPVRFYKKDIESNAERTYHPGS